MTRQTPRPGPGTARLYHPLPAPTPPATPESEPVPATGWLFTDYAMI